MKKAHIVLLVFLFGYAVSVAAQSDPLKGPWDLSEKRDVDHGQDKDHGSNVVGLIGLFREYVSPIDGSRCPMYPSCSGYSMECFKKNGLLMGWIMTWDRLYRCGRDELMLSPQVLVHGERKSFDPVENNDFWWRHEKD